MIDVSLEITSDLVTHVNLSQVLTKQFPDIEKTELLMFAMTTPQKIKVTIMSLALLVSIIQLVHSYQQSSPNSSTEIVITDNQTGKSMEIKTTDEDLDIEGIIDSFFSEKEIKE